MAKRTAIIDIGSNSIRMVIYEKTSRFAFHLLYEAKSRVRISENAYKDSNNLQKEALQRAYSVLEEFLLIIKSYGANKTLCVATSALRDAPNKQDFISKVKKELGLNIKVIDGQREAYLGGIAAANLLYIDSALTVDIGGGSTELALYENKKVTKTISLNIGTVRLKELFFDNDDINGAKEYINQELSKLSDEFLNENIIGIGGTLRALAKLIMDKNSEPYKKLHGFCYKVKDEEEFYEKIIHSSDIELKELGIKKERLDIIRPGVLILHTLIKFIKAKFIITSGVGVREGLFLSDLLRSNNDIFPSNFNPSIKSLTDRFQRPKSEINSEAKKLFDLVKEELDLDNELEFPLLQAVKLSHIAKELNFYQANRHAYYILLNSLNYGFSHKQTLLISTLVRFQEKGSVSSSHIKKYKDYLPEEEKLNKLIYLMALIHSIYNNFNHGKTLDISLKETVLHVDLKYDYLMRDKIKNFEDESILSIKFI